MSKRESYENDFSSPPKKPTKRSNESHKGSDISSPDASGDVHKTSTHSKHSGNVRHEKHHKKHPSGQPAGQPAVAPDPAESGKKIAELKEALARVSAEYENYRKRAQKDIDGARDSAISSFAKDITEVLENLYRAIGSIDQERVSEDNTLKQIFDGVVMIQKSCISIFERYGIKRIYPLHEQFDYNMHQAIGQQASNEYPPNTVLEVVKAGYIQNNKLIQPAVVIVSTEEK